MVVEKSIIILNILLILKGILLKGILHYLNSIPFKINTPNNHE